jgi:hypothetical protein
VVTSATLQNGVLVLTGSVTSIPNTTVRIEVFANTSLDPNGKAQGRIFLGSFNVVTDKVTGIATLLSLPTSLAKKGQVITLTATDALGNASEFSAPVYVN